MTCAERPIPKTLGKELNLSGLLFSALTIEIFFFTMTTRGFYGPKVKIEEYHNHQKYTVLDAKVFPGFGKVLLFNGDIIIPYDESTQMNFLREKMPDFLKQIRSPGGHANSSLARDIHEAVKALKIDVNGERYGFTSLSRDRILEILNSHKDYLFGAPPTSIAALDASSPHLSHDGPDFENSDEQNVPHEEENLEETTKVICQPVLDGINAGQNSLDQDVIPRPAKFPKMLDLKWDVYKIGNNSSSEPATTFNVLPGNISIDQNQNADIKSGVKGDCPDDQANMTTEDLKEPFYEQIPKSNQQMPDFPATTLMGQGMLPCSEQDNDSILEQMEMCCDSSPVEVDPSKRLPWTKPSNTLSRTTVINSSASAADMVKGLGASAPYKGVSLNDTLSQLSLESDKKENGRNEGTAEILNEILNSLPPGEFFSIYYNTENYLLCHFDNNLFDLGSVS